MKWGICKNPTFPRIGDSWGDDWDDAIRPEGCELFYERIC